MTDDLVQRLRRTYLKEYAPTGSMVGDISNRLRPFPILATEVLFNPDGREAADRIEALQADNAKMREALGWFLNDSRFVVQVGGNPYVVPQMIEAAQAALQETGQ